MLVVVVDINGVLGDVRKSRHSVSDRQPDVFMLSSNQVFYWRPGAKAFIQRLKNIPEVCLMLWTSRLRRNAAAIEEQLSTSRIFHAMLHGEDCYEKRDYHPVKNVRTLRNYYVEIRDAAIAFVDDKPQYVITDSNSLVVKSSTYDAAKNDIAAEKEELDRIALQIENIALQCNSSTFTV